MYIKVADKPDVRQYTPGTVVQVAIGSESVASVKASPGEAISRWCSVSTVWHLSWVVTASEAGGLRVSEAAALCLNTLELRGNGDVKDSEFTTITLTLLEVKFELNWF